MTGGTGRVDKKCIRSKILDQCSKSHAVAVYMSKYVLVALVFSFLSNSLIAYFENELYVFLGYSYKDDRTFRNYNQYSSVWCNINSYDSIHRACLFNNLCWLPSEEKFIFLLGEDSTVSGLTDWRELSALDFSSVDGHNQFFMKIAVIDAPVSDQHPMSNFSIIEEYEWIYLMWRFKPDNVMHILHDDLIPLFSIYEEICGGNIQNCVEKYNLIFVDDSSDEFSQDLYEIFSSKMRKNTMIHGGKPASIKSNWKNYPNSSICFKHARIGLRSTSSWFQYGFGKPQGAIESPNVSMTTLRKFSKFVLHGMNIRVPDGLLAGNPQQSNQFSPRALYLSRSINRRVLNEIELLNATKTAFSEVMETPSELQFFNPAPNSTSSGVKEMLQVIVKRPSPRLILGMHGAAFTVAAIFCLGLNDRNDSMAFMELFPMGINPVAVSPLHALIKAVQLESANQIFYESWTNEDPSKSFLPSANTDPLLGGGDLCLKLDLRSILPPVKCCHDREYLCRMFQDTIVDVESTYLHKLRSLLLQQKLNKDENAGNYKVFKWFFPASVHNVRCVWNMTKNMESLIISWDEPVNLYMHTHHYDVAVTLKYRKVNNDALRGAKYSDALGSEVDEVHLKDFSLQVRNPAVNVKIPLSIINSMGYTLKALIWVQSIVMLEHMESVDQRTSLDTYYECLLLL